ncbi:MAG: NADH-quinone oxidoreductase subunit A [Balneolales bacterium]
MIESYIPILVLIVVAIGLGLLLMGLSRVLGPYRPNAQKLGPYESGMDVRGQARERYSVSFYIIAMEFIVFDLEVVFIYPWAVKFRELGATSFWAMMIFITILLLGLVYTLKKGTLDWELKAKVK